MKIRRRLFAATFAFLLASAIGQAQTVPVITSISPASVYLNSAGFTLTVNGTGFASGDIIYLTYGTPLTTTYVSSTKLTAQVNASYLTATYNYTVYVENSLNEGSNTETFSVVDPTPYFQSISPTSVVAGSAATTLTIIGSSFMTGASVQWNGKSLPTTYVNSSELQITPKKSDFAGPGIVPITITNPAPGGVSSSQNFDVTYAATITTLDLPANDIVWDPYAQLLYASLPSSYGENGNTIAVINPATGKVNGYYFAGSEPTQLALSSDSQYLYVGLNGNGSVQRLILPNFTPDIDVSLGTSNQGLSTALQLAVDPGDDHTWAVVPGTTNCCGTYGLYFYKDSAELPDFINNYPYIDNFLWTSASNIYGYGSYTVSQVAVNANGGTISQQWTDDLEGTTINYAAGLLYGNDGRVFNPATGFLVGSYDLSGSSCCNNNDFPVLPSAPLNRLYALGQTPFFAGFGITAYNLTEFTPVAVANLSQLSESSSSSFIPWGNSGAAFVITPNCCNQGGAQLEIVKSSSLFLASGTAKNPVPTAKSLSPASATHGGWNFPVTITGTGFVPGTTVTWNGATLYAAYVSSTQLTLYVPYSQIASAGTAKVVVSNPAPGGGKAAALTFTIN